MLLLCAVTMALIKDQRILCSFLIIILDHYTRRILVLVTSCYASHDPYTAIIMNSSVNLSQKICNNLQHFSSFADKNRILATRPLSVITMPYT